MLNSTHAPRGAALTLLSLLALGTSACAGPRMVVPSDVLSVSRAFEAEDRSRVSGLFADESFKLGAYQVAEVDRDATSKRSLNIGGYGKSATTTGYTYQLSNGDRSLEGGCGSLAKSQGVSLGGGTEVNWGTTEITCTCESEGSTSKVQITGGDDATSGALNVNDAAFEVSAVTETEPTSYGSPIAGFRVDRNGTPAGAVETLYPGKVWLEKSIEEVEADHLTCLSVGLMLYLPPSDR